MKSGECNSHPSDDLYFFVEFWASKWITTGRPVTLSRPSPVRGLLSLISRGNSSYDTLDCGALVYSNFLKFKYSNEVPVTQKMLSV